MQKVVTLASDAFLFAKVKIIDGAEAPSSFNVPNAQAWPSMG